MCDSEVGVNFEDRPEMGARILATAKMHRRYGAYGTSKEDSVWWEVIDLSKNPLAGIYVGWRSLQNGRVHRDFGEGSYFQQSGVVRCALIVTNERYNPVRVPFEQIELE